MATTPSSPPASPTARRSGMRQPRSAGCPQTPAENHRAWTAAPSRLTDAPEPFCLIDHFNAVLLRIFQFRAGAGSCHQEIGVLRYRSRYLGPEPLGHGLCLLARNAFERPA